MMICPECGTQNPDGLTRCIHCGHPLTTPSTAENAPTMPNGKARKIKFFGLFSDVLKDHSSDDAEALFIVGTAATTPDIHEQAKVQPRPWFFARILVAVLLLYLGFYIGLVDFHNLNFLPGLIMIGAFLTPVSILLFFWELNTPGNISLYKTVQFFLIGGLFALLYSVLLYSFTDGYTFPLVTGVVEETAKLCAILIFAGRRRYPYILNGLLIGAAVGTGFAAFESSGYILLTALTSGVPVMLKTIFWRSILAPGGHIAWAGLTGAALMLVKEGEHFNPIRLLHIRFFKYFLLAVILHTLWDTPIPQPFLENIPVYAILLTIISWIALFGIIKKGIRQISAFDTETQPQRDFKAGAENTPTAQG